MSTEAHIKETLEEYLGLETSLKNYTRERDEALNKYNRRLQEHQVQDNTFDLHSAAHIISAYEEVKESDQKVYDTKRRLNELREKIKGYISALNGGALHIRFLYDSLEHRAGDHLFYVENGELLARHSPVSAL
jgi:hypothetical protein